MKDIRFSAHKCDWMVTFHDALVTVTTSVKLLTVVSVVTRRCLENSQLTQTTLRSLTGAICKAQRSNCVLRTTIRVLCVQVIHCLEILFTFLHTTWVRL